MTSPVRPRIAVFAAGAVSFLNLYATQSLLPELTRQFSATEAAVALTVSAATVSVAVTAPFAGTLADAIGRKRTVIGAVLLLLVPTLLAALAQSLHELILWRLLQGLCLPAIFAVTVAHISEQWPADERADVTALYMAGSVLGGFSGRFVSALIEPLAGWRFAFVALAAITVVCAVVLIRWLPADAPKPPGRRSGIAAILEAWRGHLTNPRLLAVCVVGFLMLFTLQAVFTWVNFHLSQPPFSLTTTQLGFIFAVYLAGVVVTPTTGRLLRRFGARGTVALAAAVSSLGLVATLAESLPVVIAGLAAGGVGVFVTQAVAMGRVGQVVPSGGRSSAVGLYVLAYYLGGSVGPVGPAPVWHAFGWPGVVAVGIAAATLAGVIAALAWKPVPAIVPQPDAPPAQAPAE
ncbi:MFS transporter [Caenispirillum bisanense]|uniref:MFS transporter n=1 Tax=Caenispirillum bisanense TaxID=414052 RepID=UPI0031DB15BB